MSEDSGNRLGLGVLFGGPSGEHEVSLMSARAVWESLDLHRYRPHALAIARDGTWLKVADPARLFECGRVDGFDADGSERVTLLPGAGGGLFVESGRLDVDVVFPVLHGPFGEDGSVQGALEILGIPYVGAGVASSGVSMDKHLMKRMFSSADLPVVEYRCFASREVRAKPAEVASTVKREVGYPCFVKPAALGSSLGINRVDSEAELVPAMNAAADLGEKVLVERCMVGRELECSVLGNGEPKVAGPGEVVPAGDFYDYNSKYFDDRTKLLVPAPVDREIGCRARELSLEAFRAVDARGMARVDLFYSPGDGRLVVNEINTIPGFTPMSMYPRLWIEEGFTFGSLVDRLVDLALEEGNAHN